MKERSVRTQEPSETAAHFIQKLKKKKKVLNSAESTVDLSVRSVFTANTQREKTVLIQTLRENLHFIPVNPDRSTSENKK